jgi:hypothetical protein
MESCIPRRNFKSTVSDRRPSHVGLANPAKLYSVHLESWEIIGPQKIRTVSGRTNKPAAPLNRDIRLLAEAEYHFVDNHAINS